jgi:hypothetical protein
MLPERGSCGFPDHATNVDTIGRNKKIKVHVVNAIFNLSGMI